MPASRPPPMKNTGNLVLAVRAIRRTVTATWQRRPRAKASDVAAGSLTSALSWRRRCFWGAAGLNGGGSTSPGTTWGPEVPRAPSWAKSQHRPGAAPNSSRPPVPPETSVSSKYRVYHAAVENPAFSVLARPGGRIWWPGLDQPEPRSSLETSRLRRSAVLFSRRHV